MLKFSTFRRLYSIKNKPLNRTVICSKNEKRHEDCKKTFYMTKFYLMFLNKLRSKNLKVNNYANMLLLNQQRNVSPIPKIIWLYWEDELPIFVQHCIDNIHSKNPEYVIHVLNPQNLQHFCDIDFSSLNIELVQHKADLIRFYLLYQYGGFWLDASIIVYEDLDWIQTLIAQNRTESFAYYRKKNTTQMDSPVIENWLLASVPKTAFFKAWYEELSSALQQGAKNYIQHIRNTVPESEKIFQKISNLEYLVAYVVCQVVMQQEKPSMTLIVIKMPFITKSKIVGYRKKP